MQILLIEDEVFFRELLTEALTDEGHEVLATADGEEGFEVFNQAQELDVVLTDVQIPRLDGMELLEKIRAKTRDIPVICMTGHGDLEVAQKAISLGAFELLLKPFPIDQLLKILRRVQRLRCKMLKPLEVLPWVTQDEFEVLLPSDPALIESTIALLQIRLEVIYKKFPITPFKIALAFYEALTNAIVHGNLEIPSESKESEEFEALLEERKQTAPWADRKVLVHLSIQMGCFVLEIEDEGSGFTPPVPMDLTDPMNFLSLSGRGILLMRMHMDEVQWNTQGNRLTMVKNFPVAA